jgi:hypothetical protein
MRLYILGQEIEIKGVNIAQTKQANDIGRLETRQTNFTNSFSIPRTAKNIRTLNDLGIIGNNSNVPYQKNEAYLYADNGECLIYKGWAIFNEASNEFKCNIYDGNLEIYKAIENKTLADLDLSAISHTKTLAEVTSTFDNSKPYKYILADYNGKMIYDTDRINIDYLVPSVKASYLIEQIELYSGFKLNGSYRTNPNFTGLFMTYPKGIGEVSTTDLLVSNDLTSVMPYHLSIATYSVLNPIITLVNPQTFAFGELCRIKININSNFKVKAVFASVYIIFDFIQKTNGIETIIDTYTADGSAKNITYDTTANENDSISFYIKEKYNNDAIILESGGFIDISIKKYDDNEIDFIDELKGMTIKEFLNEILWQFSLSLFKSKYDNIYALKTVSERTNQTNAIDWSHKFNGEISEKYIFGSYAQQNFFKYKYNDQNASYNDGSFLLDNKNLEASKTVIQSKIYSPELSISNALGFNTNVYKLWDKTPKDDGTTTYKPLANRFYFIKSVNKTFTALKLGSESLGTTATVTNAPVESYSKLKFGDVIFENYSELRRLINKSIIKTAYLNLKDSDVSDLDLSIPYYFKQLGGSFLINKVSNYLPNKKTTVELIRINYSNEEVDFTPSHYSEIHYSSLHYST